MYCRFTLNFAFSVFTSLWWIRETFNTLFAMVASWMEQRIYKVRLRMGEGSFTSVIPRKAIWENNISCFSILLIFQKQSLFLCHFLKFELEARRNTRTKLAKNPVKRMTFPAAMWRFLSSTYLKEHRILFYLKTDRIWASIDRSLLHYTSSTQEMKRIFDRTCLF